MRPKALELVRGGQGKAAMDQIRASMDTIRRIGGAAIAARDEHTDRVENWLRIGSLAALLAIFLLGAYTIRLSRRRFREVAVAQEELMRKNIALGNEIQTRETGRIADPPDAEDGGGRPADRRHRPRFQQHAGGRSSAP